MWVDRRHYEFIITAYHRMLNEVNGHQERIADLQTRVEVATDAAVGCHTQKSKDDITIDWMRHRINALEKERTILLQKAAGISLPTPEIEITPARQAVADLNWDHGFEDVGDEEAKRLGIQHNDLGEVVYDKALA